MRKIGFFLPLFFQIFQRPPHRFHYEGGEGAVFALDLGFYLVNDVVGKADALLVVGGIAGILNFFMGISLKMG